MQSKPTALALVWRRAPDSARHAYAMDGVVFEVVFGIVRRAAAGGRQTLPTETVLPFAGGVAATAAQHNKTNQRHRQHL